MREVVDTSLPAGPILGSSGRRKVMHSVCYMRNSPQRSVLVFATIT
jgi:hypothetical protein